KLNLRVARRLRAVERRPRTSLERTFGDTGDREHHWRTLHGLQQTFEGVRGAAERSAAALDEACREHHVETVQGDVVKVDDLRRRVRLADGTVVGLKQSGCAAGVYPGGWISGRAKVFPDGTRFFDDVVVDAENVLAGDPGPRVALR